jgi:hypothetical protein
MSNETPSASVVKVGAKKCRPFIIEVMVYSPESGFKAEVVVERGCTATNDSVFKFVFDLFKRKASGDGFDQLVHVSYRPLNAKENAAIAGMIDGLNDDQLDKLPELHESSKTFHENPTTENQVAVTNSARSVVTAGI